MDAQTLAKAMDHRVSMARYEALAPAWNAALIQAGCTTVDRVAMWCAQIGHESGGLKWMEEIADGSAYEGRRDLGNTQAGDGKRFKGRGPIQVTGRFNYARLSTWAHAKGYVPSPTYFVDRPHELSEVRWGFLGAVWYWTTQRPLNDLSDRRDLDGATRAVNGGLNGLADRRKFYDRALALGTALLPTEELPVSAAEEIKHQLTGSPKPGEYPGWEQLGDQTMVDALADVRDVLIRPFESAIDENGKVAFTLPQFIAFIDAAAYRTEKAAERIEAALDRIETKLGSK